MTLVIVLRFSSYSLPSAKSGVVTRINMVTYIHFEFRGFENESMPEGELS
jgi:hypothetical protein